MNRANLLNVLVDHSVDVVLVTMIDNELNVLLTQRKDDPSDPFPLAWGMPGVYLNAEKDTSYEDAAIRALNVKAHLNTIPHLEQLQSFGNSKRDPRHWTGTLVYIGYVHNLELTLQGNDVQWVPVSQLEHLSFAFDHKSILEYAISQVKEQAQYKTNVIRFLGEEFTQPQLQELYEIVLGEALDKSSFRKQVRESELLVEIEGKKIKPPKGAPAKAYAMNPYFEGFFFPRSISKANKK